MKCRSVQPLRPVASLVSTTHASTSIHVWIPGILNHRQSDHSLLPHMQTEPASAHGLSTEKNAFHSSGTSPLQTIQHFLVKHIRAFVGLLVSLASWNPSPSAPNLALLKFPSSCQEGIVPVTMDCARQSVKEL
eukprot:1160890-Pelagomonas_calceolata.AAC.11